MRIAIIGAGPRGLQILYHLALNYDLSNIMSLNIYIFDNYPIGGKVWQANQYSYLIMDTICQQVTEFNTGDGPNLYQWIKGKANDYIDKLSPISNLRKKQILKTINEIKPNDYAPRYFYSFYLKWFYNYVYHNAPTNVHILNISHSVVDLRAIGNDYQILTANNCIYNIDKAVFNLGQEINEPTEEHKHLVRYSIKHNLLYSPLGYVEEKRVSSLKPKKNVIIRGLGLDFADCINILSLGRGGKYINHNGIYSYCPSGKEPYIIAGSRHGLPYYCKANNQKRNGLHPQPYFISKKSILRHLIGGKLSFKMFIYLIKLDMELVYYSRLILIKYPNYNARLFIYRFKNTNHPQNIINYYNFKSNDYFNLKHILYPLQNIKIVSIKNYQKIVEKWLLFVIEEANKGNLRDPLFSALEILRDGRNDIRFIVDNHLLSNYEYYYKFLPIFNKINSMLVMGPPLKDFKYYYALMKAGILTILPPGIKIKTSWFKFRAYSKVLPNKEFKAKALIEARNPSPKIAMTKDPLIKNLFKRGLLSPYYVMIHHNWCKIDCANVKPDTDQLIDKNGKINYDLYTWGLSTEGLHWCTANTPHCSGHDANLITADSIAKSILKIPHESLNLMQ